MKLFPYFPACFLFLSCGVLTADDKMEAVPDLVCFWDFDEAEGEVRVSKGKENYSLEEVNGPITRVEGSAPGKHAVRIKSGQYFRIPDGKFEAIDFHGPDAQLSVVALVRRQAASH